MLTLEIIVSRLVIITALSLIAALGIGLFLAEIRACRRDGRSLLTGRAKS